MAYPVKVYQSRPGILYEDEEYLVSCGPLKHKVTAFGYRIEEKDRPGRFNVEKAKALGIPPGPIYGHLKRGEWVTLPDGDGVSEVALDFDHGSPGGFGGGG